MTDWEKKEKIRSLIRKVDAEYQTTFVHVILNVELGVPFIFIFLVYILVGFGFTDTNQNNLSLIVPTFVSFIALVFSFFALMDRNKDHALEERNYTLMLFNYNRQGKIAPIKELWLLLKTVGQKKPKDPLLKALIRIKVKNSGIKLEDLFDKNPSLFTEEKLVESLLHG